MSAIETGDFGQTFSALIAFLCLFLLLQSSAHKIPNDHDNYRGYDYYENMFCSYFLSFLSKKTCIKPICKDLFSLKYPCAQEEKNYIRDKGSAGDNPISSGIHLITPTSVGLLQPIIGSIKARSKTPMNITGMAFQSIPSYVFNLNHSSHKDFVYK